MTTDADAVYARALEALRRAECEYGAAETKLIHARRAVEVAQSGTSYEKMMRKITNG